mgnify:CR=1 FL=1
MACRCFLYPHMVSPHRDSFRIGTVTKTGQPQPAMNQLLSEELEVLRANAISLAERILNAQHTDGKRKPVSPNSIIIRVFGLDGYSDESPYKFRVDNAGVYRGLAASALLQCMAACSSAHKALSQDWSLNAFKDYSRAAKLLGRAQGLVEFEKVLSVMAKVRADMRHEPTRNTRSTAIKLWAEKCNPTDSSQEAAGRLYGLIRWPNGDDVPYRTLAKWIAEERRKLRDKTRKLPPTS